MSDKTGKMILIKDGVNIDIFDDKNMSDKVSVSYTHLTLPTKA